MSNSQYSDLDSRTDWFRYRCNSSRINSFTCHIYEFGIPTSNSFAPLSKIDDVFTSPNPAPAARSSPIGTKTATHAILISSYNSRSADSTGQTLSSSGTSSPSGPRLHAESAHVTRDNASAGTSSTGSHPSQSPRYFPCNKGAQWRSIVMNINSLVGKVACVKNLLDFTKPDSVVITETKLNPSINTAQVIPPEWGFTVYRRDRPYSTRGGGVMLLIKDHYTSTEIHSSSDCEVVWAEVKLKNSTVSVFLLPAGSWP